MSNREASLQELLVSSFQSQSNNMYTAIPCVVVAIRESLEGAMVDIQPTINQKTKDGTVKERATILGVPVSFPVSSSAGVLFPVRVGTTGTAIFSMRNLDAWKSSNGNPSTPLNFAKFDKGDALFFPGIQPPGVSLSNPSKHIWQHSTDDVVVFNNIGTSTENEYRLKASGDIQINTNQDVFVVCNNANVTAQQDITLNCANLDVTADTATFAITSTSWIGSITQVGNYIQTGNYTLTGTATMNGIAFDTHKHTGVQTGIGTSGGPTN